MKMFSGIYLLPLRLATLSLLLFAIEAKGDDLTHEDLGFNTNYKNSKLGDIADRAYSHRDWDARFVINNLPISYKQPSTKEDLPEFERRLKQALIAARQKPDSSAKGLSLLLEGGASFFQKQNEFREAFTLMDELVQLQKRISPASEELAKAELICARAARAMHKYSAAEQYLADALAIYKQLDNTEQIAETKAELFYLYMDEGRQSKALLARKDGICTSGHDAVAEDGSHVHGVRHNAWPLITTTLDSVATGQDLENKEKEADKAAKEQLYKELEKEKQQTAEKEKQEKEKRDKERQAREKDTQQNNDKDKLLTKDSIEDSENKEQK